MEREEKTDFRPADRRLILALFLATGGWALHLNLSYILMPQSCENGSKAILHLVTVVCLALTGCGGLMAWRTPARHVPDTEGVAWRERARWMAMMIAVFAAGLMLVIVAQEMPNLILGSCD